jgi:co-chaperonin GroES (HSP10)
MNITPLNDSVIFEFLDTISAGMFATKTRSGIILGSKNPEENAQTPRWGKVHAVGPDVIDVSVGNFVLIAPLRWTTSFKLDGIELSKTVEKEIMCVADDVTDPSQLFR